MEIVKPRITVVDEIDGKAILKKIEKAGRICWQSEPKEDSAETFVRNLIKRGHTSVLEHVQITFNVITDRGVGNELVRHRIASYSQESTRYCSYQSGLEFIEPIEFTENTEEAHELMYEWVSSCEDCERHYINMMNIKKSPESARSVVNLSLKTEIEFSMNLRSLRNFFMLRCDKAAHPHIKEIAIPLLLELRKVLPVVFDDITYDEVFVDKFFPTREFDFVHINATKVECEEVFIYDEFGNTLKYVDVNGVVIEYTYDEDFHIIATKHTSLNSNFNEVRMYDIDGYLTSINKTYNDGNIETWCFNKALYKISHEDSNGCWQRWNYDDDNNLISIENSDGERQVYTRNGDETTVSIKVQI